MKKLSVFLRNQRQLKILIYTLYSYGENLLYFFLQLLPYCLAKYIYKLFFCKLGNGGFIDFGCYFRYPGKISIGDQVSINRGCHFFASFMAQGGTITIGDRVAIAPDVCIFAAGHDYRFLDLPDIAQPVVIESDVWIGGRSIILPGVIIGRGSVIGAGSVVTKNIPAYSIAVGNPARVVKKRILLGSEKV